MRFALCTVLFVLAVAPALAGGVNPSALALRQADIPAGFALDRSESGVRSNAVEAKQSAEAGRFFARWHRVTGYQTVWRRGEQRIEARADVFTTAEGSRKLLEWSDLQARRSGITGFKRARVRIGAGGWMYSGGFNRAVIWRYGRVWAGVGGSHITTALTLELARKQQRRIAVALG